MKGMVMQSHVTGRYYYPERCCFIMNPKQAALYMKNGIDLLDVMVCRDDRLVYVFDKKESEPLYRKWQNYQLT